MAGSVNKVILVGNLGRDPEIRSMPNGDRIANLSIATSEQWRDRATGERKEKTEWHRVVIFNDNIVKVVENYVKKGSTVYIEGALQTRKWTDQQGVEKYATKIRATSMQMLGGKPDGAGGQAPARAPAAAPAAGRPPAAAPQQQGGFGGEDSDVPF